MATRNPPIYPGFPSGEGRPDIGHTRQRSQDEARHRQASRRRDLEKFSDGRFLNSLKPIAAAFVAVVVAYAGAAHAHGNAGAFADKHDEAKPARPPTAPAAVAPTVREPVANAPARARGETVKVARADTIEAIVASAGRGAAALRTFGRVIADPAAIVDVNAFISGEVRRVLVRPGAYVRDGDVVATIYSPEFVRTQKSYLALLQNETLQAALREEGRLPNYMKDARANLRWWGLSEAEIARLEKSGEAREELALAADASGIVTEVFVQPGQLLAAGDKTMKQFVVLGKSVLRMVATDKPFWLEGYLYPGEEQGMRVGSTVTLKIDGKPVQRTVAKIIPAVDAKAQRARFIVPLKPGDALPLGASVEVDVQIAATDGVWIPTAAVLNQGLAPIVYVRTAPTAFERRRIEILQAGDSALRVAGIDAGEAVVTAGKMLLEGNFRMAASGAGSGGHDH